MSDANLSTRVFAERVGVVPETVRRWIADELLEPGGATPGGHYRFTEEQVAEVLRGGVAARARKRGEKPRTARSEALEATIFAARAALRARRGPWRRTTA